jgi:membrane protein DedA with SNARE-associated domain
MPVGSTSRTGRTALLAAAAARGALGLVAIPLAAALYKRHFVVLVLLRPTKEVLLAGGFFVRRGEVSLLPLLAAAVPLAFFGVWLFFAIGRAYSEELRGKADGLPKWAQRVVPPDRVKAMCRVLDKRGRSVIVLGRLAAFPSTLLATAAGASGMRPAHFLVADAIGATLSIFEVVIAGYVLGAAYKEAGPWLTAVGVAALLALLFVFGRWLRKEESSGRGT